MGKDNLMGLFETQDYISSERHEWNVPVEMKDKVAQMVQKYNQQAIKTEYNDSTLNFDASSLTLRGLFVLKTEKTSWLARRFEDERNADLSGDVRKILNLCHKVCPQCNSQIPALSKVCEKCGFHFIIDTSEESKNIAVEEVEGNDSNDGIEDGIGVSYELFETHTSIEVSDEVVYRDDVLSYFDKFIVAQTAKPKNKVIYILALDVDKIDPDDLDVMIDNVNDPRWGIYSFDICNVVFNVSSI